MKVGKASKTSFSTVKYLLKAWFLLGFSGILLRKHIFPNNKYRIELVSPLERSLVYLYIDTERFLNLDIPARTRMGIPGIRSAAGSENRSLFSVRKMFGPAGKNHVKSGRATEVGYPWF